MEEVRTGSLEPSRRERETTFRKKHPPASSLKEGAKISRKKSEEGEKRLQQEGQREFFSNRPGSKPFF